MTSNPFASLEWRNIGPHRGGRVVAVAGHPTERGTFYFGGCAGGIWKTTNGGSHWVNISDGYFKTAAIGALTVCDAHPNIIYAGAGETAIRSNVSHGDGVYKSTDGGHTWQNMGLADSRHIGAIVIHPVNPDIVWVAALGHAWGRNRERGVYKTTDGGRTWRLVLHKSDRAGAIDLALDPHTPDILYAAIWQGQRYPWAAHSGGEDSGIWRSNDGGETWSEITRNKGLPETKDSPILGKIGLAASPAQAGRLWAIVEAANQEGYDNGGVFRSDDYGETWEKTSDNLDLRRRPWYYMHIFADPGDADTVWVLNLGCWKSSDGGKNFEEIPTPHGDNHGLWIDPRDSSRLIEGNDGGACVSFDGGRAWSSILNQPTAQFYHISTDTRQPYHVYGSQQDNWAMCLPSIGFEGAISWKDYIEPGGGESGHIAISPTPPHKVYGGGIGTGAGHGRLLAWNPETRQTRNVTVWPEVHGFGAGADALKYRFQWTFPIEISRHDPDVLYVCSQHVHRSTDEGHSWEEISPDLTRNDPEKIVSSGGPITADNSGAEIYCTIFAFIESPHEQGVLWAGTDDGLVHLSRDGGKHWENVTPRGLPEWSRVTTIEPSPTDAATVYLCATRYQLDDTAPYLFKTTDYGATWNAIGDGIPEGEFTRVIRCDPNRAGLLYAGTETGIWISFDDGAQWQRLETNLPVVPIWDLAVKETDLIAATHGRSFWILDDLTPLHQMRDDQSQPHLYKPRDTVRWRLYGRGFGAKRAGYTSYKMTGSVTVAHTMVETPQGTQVERYLDAGANPPAGVIVHYTLPESAEGEVTLRFLDKDGNELRSFTSEEKEGQRVPKAAGANRFVWDLKVAAPTKLEEEAKTGMRRLIPDDTASPRVPPGKYSVELKVGDTTLTEEFMLLKDPRVPASARDLQAQYDLKLQLRDEVSRVNEGLNQLRQLRTQIEATEKRIKNAGGNEEISEAAKSLTEQLTAIERALMLVEADKLRPDLGQAKEKLMTLAGMIDESDDRPTKNAGAVYTLLKEQVDEELTRLHHIVSEDVVGFNNLVLKANIPAIIL